MKDPHDDRKTGDDQPAARSAQPSSYDVDLSWLEDLSVRETAASHPAIPPPARSTPDEAYPESEAQTVPRRPAMLADESPSNAARASMPSLDAGLLMAELAWSPTPERAPSEGIRARSTSWPPAQTPSELDVAHLPGFEDLPDDTRRELMDSGTRCELATAELLKGFDLLLVVQGATRVALRRDGPAVVAGPSELISARTTYNDASMPWVVGAEPRTCAVVWHRASIDRAISLCPWFEDALEEIGDRWQTVLRLSTRLGNAAWIELVALSRWVRFEFQCRAPRTTIFERSATVSAFAILGRGAVELVDERNRVVRTVRPGNVIFGAEAIGGQKAPWLARASKSGASLLMFDPRVVAAAMPRLPVLAKNLRASS